MKKVRGYIAFGLVTVLLLGACGKAPAGNTPTEAPKPTVTATIEPTEAPDRTDAPELLLTSEDYVTLFEFIKEKRSQGEPVQYGCSHYLGTDYEREVRDWYFLCNAGIYTASVMANGDIGACLDIERRPELIFGNILRDDFTEVWKHGFGAFRRSLSEDNETCRTCKEREFCDGGAFHSWDYDKKKPKVCFKGTLFE